MKQEKLAHNFYKRHIIHRSCVFALQTRSLFVSVLKVLSSRCRDKNSSPAFPVGSVVSFLLLTAYCLLFTAYGCGYAIHKKASLSFDVISICTLENRTLEPKLQDKLHAALAAEFLKQGIAVRREAAYKLTGTINQFELRVLAEKADIATEYEVIIKGDFRLHDPEGKIKELKGIGSPFIISFSGPGPLNELIGSKELASERALKDMAAEIVAAILYR